MKRRTYTAELLTLEGGTIATTQAYAWNSAIRASEGLVRDYARSAGEPFTGELPIRTGKGTEFDAYWRTWVSDSGQIVRVYMTEEKLT